MTQPTPPQGPALVMQLLNGAHATALLTSGLELGVFGALADGPESAATVAERIASPARTTRILLDGLCALGLLAHDGQRYRLSPVASEHLVPGRPMYAGDIAKILASPQLWTGLGRLAEAVKHGGSVLEDHAETVAHPFWETFARSSAAMATAASMALDALLSDWIASKQTVRVLDIAAGSGIYGYTLANRHPNVELTALDWPNVLVETRNWGARLGVDTTRVRYLEGNLFEVDYGGPYDLVLLSHVYHHFDPATCQALSDKVARAVRPGGRVVVHDFLNDGVNPAAALFAVTMLVWTRQGTAYGADDYRGWLTHSGLKTPTVHPLPGMPTSFVVADKP